MTANEQPQKKLNLEVDEQILWHLIRKTGFFRKKTSEVLMVTNHRVMKELPQSGHLFTLLLTQINKVQVLNQYRDSNMGMTGVGVRSGNIRSTRQLYILIMNLDQVTFPSRILKY